MFTGLIQAVGTVVEWQGTDPTTGGTLVLTLPETLWPVLGEGASLAVNGCCLTLCQALTPENPTASFALSPETMEKTTLGQLLPGQPVNLEPALALGTPMGGHMVSGHVDASAEIIQITPYGNSTIMRFKLLQADKLPLIVEKGSVAIDGISLTINTVIQDVFSVAIIPHTWQNTNLRHRQVGEQVNIETDLIGRYIYHFYTTGRIPSVYDQQAKADASQGSIPMASSRMKVGEWFNGAPC